MRLHAFIAALVLGAGGAQAMTTTYRVTLVGGYGSGGWFEAADANGNGKIDQNEVSESSAYFGSGGGGPSAWSVSNGTLIVSELALHAPNAQGKIRGFGSSQILIGVTNPPGYGPTYTSCGPRSGSFSCPPGTPVYESIDFSFEFGNDLNWVASSATVTAVPLPATLPMLASAFALAAYVKRPRRNGVANVGEFPRSATA